MDGAGHMLRSKLKPDMRPHWNDDLTIIYLGREYTADEWQQMCAENLDSQTYYKNDPTYNLNRKNKK